MNFRKGVMTETTSDHGFDESSFLNFGNEAVHRVNQYSNRLNSMQGIVPPTLAFSPVVVAGSERSVSSFDYPEEPNNSFLSLPSAGCNLARKADFRGWDDNLVGHIGLENNFSRLSIIGARGDNKVMRVIPEGSRPGSSGNDNSNREENLNCGFGGYGWNAGDFETWKFRTGDQSMASCGSRESGTKFSMDDISVVDLQFGDSKVFDEYFGFEESNSLSSGSSWYRSKASLLADQRNDQSDSWQECERMLQNGWNSSLRSHQNDIYVCPSQCSNESCGGIPFVDSPVYPQQRSNLNGYHQSPNASMPNRKPGMLTSSCISRIQSPTSSAGEFNEVVNAKVQRNRILYDQSKDLDQLRAERKALYDMIIEQITESCYDMPTFHGNTQTDHGHCNHSIRRNIQSSNLFKGYIYEIAHDQDGCRYLQKIFDKGSSKDIDIIFHELINHTTELMLNPFGNYVIQKLLEVCSEPQRLVIVREVTKEPGKLVSICLNTYGTRVVQKLIETLGTREEIALVKHALKPGFLSLIKDQNGNHVIQRCLQNLSNEDSKFIFVAATKHCAEIAIHQHGCCVMQRCIEFATERQMERLILEIFKNVIFLAQDRYGNYVLQYVFELNNPCIINHLPRVLYQMRGHYVQLSTQKFGSHVVEKCLKTFEQTRPQIVHELLSVPQFDQLLQHEFANYVIQTALSVTKGPLHATLVDAVRPHLKLRTSPYCKKIFSRSLLRR